MMGIQMPLGMMTGLVLGISGLAHASVALKYTGGERRVEASCRDLTAGEMPGAVGTANEWRDVYQTIGNVLISCDQVPGRERVCREDVGSWRLRSEALRGEDASICVEARRQLARCTNPEREGDEWCPASLRSGSDRMEELCAPIYAQCRQTEVCLLSGLTWIGCQLRGAAGSGEGGADATGTRSATTRGAPRDAASPAGDGADGDSRAGGL